MKYTLLDYQNFIKTLYEQSIHGCGRNGCVIKKPIGMGTNATCKCYKRLIASDLKRIANILETGNNDWEI